MRDEHLDVLADDGLAEVRVEGIDAHRRRTAALQAALDAKDPIAITELRSDLGRLSADAQTLAAWLAAEPELLETEVRERLGRKFESACGELDALLRALN